jgi:hypothetical protein
VRPQHSAARLADYISEIAASGLPGLRGLSPDAATGEHGDKPSRSAAVPCIDALERMHISEPLSAWAPTPNPLAKLATGPKHHLADPALAAALLRLDADGLRHGSRPAAPTASPSCPPRSSRPDRRMRHQP